MRVVVAEKPSVARDVARVLGASTRGQGVIHGAGLAVTWCHGHMAELQEPAFYDAAWKSWSLQGLPMLPERMALRLRGEAGDQFGVLESLLRHPELEDVVNACDAGREGELIFRYVYELARCQAPVQRLWISSLTDQAIQQGWAALRPGSDFDRLADAARSRAESDWLVGLNATRALTCLARDAGGSGLLSVGRVQTPTLAMIVGRDLDIEAFVPQDFWQVKATFEGVQLPPEVELRTWEAIFFDPTAKETDGPKADRQLGKRKEVPKAERLDTEEAAQAIAAAVAERVGEVETAERKEVREPPPLLYDLTSLQRRANQRYGLSAQRTLALAQELYEQHKLITYPRTDARYLTPDQVPGIPAILKGLSPISVYAPMVAGLLANGPPQPGSRVIDAAEVGDHHAIIPTGRTPSASLSADAKRIFDLVARRFMAALSLEAIFDVTRLVVAVPTDGELPEGLTAPVRFRARGRVCRQEGWRAIDPPGRSKETELPAVNVGDDAAVREVRTPKGQTRPPRPHTDATLLRAMETAGRTLDDSALIRALRGKGLGTPATRASILQTLIDRRYVVRKGRDLRATDRGRALVAAVPVPALLSAELTGEWEGQLAQMADGKGKARPAFMGEVRTYVSEIVDAMKVAPPPEVDPEEAGPSLGECPACGRPVRKRGKVWACDAGRSCAFVVFSRMSKRAISARMVKQLLADGRSPVVKGFKSKAGKDFSAGLLWDEERGRVGFFFEDEKPRDRGGQQPSEQRSSAPSTPAGPREGAICPTCGTGRIIRGRTALGCSEWRAGCGYRAALPT
ncbi:MAG: DNA topoisomerase 3 [Myxococcales bacterium]|nr:DNA topoisomerase 3 [Myxococcales bacterium]